jgi:hypothetical protein
MMRQSIASVAAPSSAPDRGHPTTFIICEQDQALPPAAQEQTAAAADHLDDSLRHINLLRHAR